MTIAAVHMLTKASCQIPHPGGGGGGGGEVVMLNSRRC